MAEIFLARAHTDLGASRLCVVKQILPEFALHPQFAEMLIHEAKLAARLNHAHIVQVFDLGREGDQLFIAMEYVEGFDLNALLRRCSQKKLPLPFEFALRIVSDALQGLDYAHRRTTDEGKPLGIVHRDVSPSNLLISLEGEVKVCDFGIAHANDLVLRENSPARRAGDQSTSDMDEAIKGKAGYMSPEHARGEPIDARADVFAVGIVLWELVAGKRMYRKESDVPLLEQAKRGEIPDLPVKGLPHEERLHGIVKKALAAKREDRYPSAGAMLRDLEAFMSEAKMVASPLKLGGWLMDSFGADLADHRRGRDRLTPVPSASGDPSPSSKHATPSVPSIPGAPSASQVSSRPPPAGHTPSNSGLLIAPADVPPAPRAADPDPPSLPASTMDVVPSSGHPIVGTTARSRSSRTVLWVALAIGFVIAVLIAFFAGFRR